MSTTTQAPPEAATREVDFWGNPHGGTLPDPETPDAAAASAAAAAAEEAQKAQAASEAKGETPPVMEDAVPLEEENGKSAPKADKHHSRISAEIADFREANDTLEGMKSDPAYAEHAEAISSLQACLARYTVMQVKHIQSEQGAGDAAQMTEDELKERTDVPPSDNLEGLTLEEKLAKMKERYGDDPDVRQNFETLEQRLKAEKEHEKGGLQAEQDHNAPGASADVGGTPYKPVTAADKIAEDTAAGPGATQELKDQVGQEQQNLRSELRQAGASPDPDEAAKTVEGRYQQNTAEQMLDQNTERAGFEAKKGAGAMKPEDPNAKQDKADSPHEAGATTHPQGVDSISPKPVQADESYHQMLDRLIEDGRRVQGKVEACLPPNVARDSMVKPAGDFIENHLRAYSDGYDNMVGADGKSRGVEPPMVGGGVKKQEQVGQGA